MSAADHTVSQLASLSPPGDPLPELLRKGLIEPPVALGTVGRLARFDLVRMLGQGGMGVVFLARDTDDGSLVALKTS